MKTYYIKLQTKTYLLPISIAHHFQHLTLLYPHPYLDLFLQARSMAKDDKKWMLVNIQSHLEFSSQMMNRDTFVDETIITLLRTSFVFWQRGACVYLGLFSLNLFLSFSPFFRLYRSHSLSLSFIPSLSLFHSLSFSHQLSISLIQTHPYTCAPSGHTSPDAKSYMRAHSVQETDLPHIAVIDSRTGAKIITMKGVKIGLNSTR